MVTDVVADIAADIVADVIAGTDLAGIDSISIDKVGMDKFDNIATASIPAHKYVYLNRTEKRSPEFMRPFCCAPGYYRTIYLAFWDIRIAES